ncbi:MAG: hypothetical protein AB7V39_23165 [Nitrospiraceae bacterium]
MDQSPVEKAIHQIDQADLTAAQYRAARRLLDIAQAGHVKLTKERVNERCATTSDGATRRLLGGLQQAGIIHYSVNSFVYIDFTAWSPMDKLTHRRTFAAQEWVEETDANLTVDKKSDHPRALLDRTRAKSDHDCCLEAGHNLTVDKKSDHPRALLDHPRANSDHPRALLDHEGAATYTRELVSLLDPIPSIEKNLANKLTPDAESQALSFALLTHVRVKPATLAKQLAAAHSLTTIREAASHWWFNRKSVGGTFEETPGIVVYWLNNWQSAGVPPLTDRFVRTDLYRNYRTQVELAESDQAHFSAHAPILPILPDSQAASAPEPTETDPCDSAWQQVCNEVVLSLPEVTAQWLRNSYIYAIDGATWYIAVTDQRALDWLRNRLAIKVQRILASIIGKTITVEFCLPEATQ